MGNRKPVVRLNHSQWNGARLRLEAGEHAAGIARSLGISPGAVYMRAKKEKWVWPGREKGGNAPSAASETALTDVSVTPARCNPIALLDRLQAVAAGPPEEFQRGLAALLQHWLALGAAGVEPPKNLAEMKTAFDLFRKAAGLDVADRRGDQASAPSPMRTLPRRSAPVVDVTPEPEPEPEPDPDMEDI
jgi:hypothetical protein